MSTIGEVTLAVWLIVGDVTAVTVFTLPLLNQALAVVVTIGVMQATPSAPCAQGKVISSTNSCVQSNFELDVLAFYGVWKSILPMKSL